MSIEVKCTDVLRDNNNKIIMYKLEDATNKEKWFGVNELKDAMRFNTIRVSNLKLLKNNRIAYIKNDNAKKKSTSNSANVEKYDVTKEMLLEKARDRGWKIWKVPIINNMFCDVVTKRNNEHIIFIDADIIEIEPGAFNNLVDYSGCIKLYGGENLMMANRLFAGCTASVIDITGLCKTNIKDIGAILQGNKAKTVKY